MAALLMAWGCGGGDDGLHFDTEPDAGPDVGQEGDAGGDASTGEEGGTGACTSALQCDDGIACTIDVCVKGVCSHYAGPNEGGTACPSGQYCEVGKGCVQGIACANDAQCEERFGGDACKAHIACDPVVAICTFRTLDRDNDGRVPLVCGGDDCNDADNSIHGMHPEICDGKDNDCNGIVDDGAICPGARVCQAGQCVCPPANQCGIDCVDKASDRNHCGTCNRACGGELACENGQCVCAAPAVTCDGACVNIETSFQHCGGCNKPCQAGHKCESGKCVKAPCTPPALLIMQDQSGSMLGGRWEAVKEGLQTFMQRPASAGISMGIGYFPLVSNQCSAFTYETPAVPVAPIPGNASAIMGSFPASPSGGSILTAPIEGSTKYLSGWAKANPLSQAAVVIVVDNEPNQCTPADSIENAALVAANAANASPAVKVFVVGIGGDVTQPRLSVVSQAGGAGSAYLVNTAAEITTALAEIRDTMAMCP